MNLKKLRYSFLSAALICTSLLHGAEKPNFVIIMVDDLGFSDFGCYGSEIETPNIDRLAENGARFTQFYNTAKCHSSRVCLMSGQWCHLADKPRGWGQGLSKAATIAEVLKPAGYFTAMTGKWHLDGNPVERGFDRYFGHLSGANTEWGMKFINEGIAKKKPFLLYIAHNAPHYPLQVREPDFRKYENRYKEGWDLIRRQRFEKQKQVGLFSDEKKLPKRPGAIPSWNSLSAENKSWESRRMAAYAGMIDRIDQQVGRLTAFLQEKGVLDNTVILLFSDNGGCPFERTKGKNLNPWDPESYWTYDTSWAWVSNTPFKYYKQNQHEGGTHSPMIVHWPAGLKAKGLITRPAHLVDILPTLIDLGGGTYPAQIKDHKVRPFDGRSMAPLFSGTQNTEERELFFQYAKNYALRQGDWKLVSCTDGAWELYNLKSDPFEENNIAAQHPERVSQMEKRYIEIWGAPLKLKKVPGQPTTHRAAKHRKNKNKLKD
jgi:arylsulfatase A-like enzyme